MKKILLIFITMIISACQKQAEITFSVSHQDINLSIKNQTLFYKDKKFTGQLYTLAENKCDTLIIESFINGVLDGVSQKWFSNKMLQEERMFKNGMKNGKQIAYFPNGQKRFEYKAINDTYEGELKEWNDQGLLIHLGTFKKGKEEGPQKLWYDDGKIRANYVMFNGKRYGLLGTKNCENVSDSIFNN